MRGLDALSMLGGISSSPTVNNLLQLALSQGMSPASGGVAAAANVRPSGDIQRYARRSAREMFGRGHWGELNNLVSQESSWSPSADNPTSTAYGLFQFLDDTWKSGYGGLRRPTNNPYKQINAGLDYIAARYGNPTKAWNFHTRNNWY